MPFGVEGLAELHTDVKALYVFLSEGFYKSIGCEEGGACAAENMSQAVAMYAGLTSASTDTQMTGNAGELFGLQNGTHNTTHQKNTINQRGPVPSLEVR
jgi:hypothetical protein